MSELVLKVGEEEFAGWKNIRVSRSMQDLAGSFTLEVTERWADNPTPRRIKRGDACQVLIDGVAVITGSVDATPVDYDDSSHRLSVQGRDRTGDLVDCSAPTLQWIGRSLAQVATQLCKPFGIKVIDESGADRPFQTYRPGDGESIFEALEKGARFRGALLTTDGLGRLVITRVGTDLADDALELGVNVISASGSFDVRDCFSVYTVKGQQQGGGDLGEACHVIASVKDSKITRHRPLILLCDGPADAQTAREKAVWERNVRQGRAESVTYTVYGWKQSTGKLWRPNLRVPVKDAYQQIDDERLIADVNYSLDDSGGEICELTVVPISAFSFKPEKDPVAESIDESL
jgi:prophage tail gpP-like protein